MTFDFIQPKIWFRSLHKHIYVFFVPVPIHKSSMCLFCMHFCDLKKNTKNNPNQRTHIELMILNIVGLFLFVCRVVFHIHGILVFLIFLFWCCVICSLFVSPSSYLLYLLSPSTFNRVVSGSIFILYAFPLWCFYHAVDRCHRLWESCINHLFSFWFVLWHNLIFDFFFKLKFI